MSRLQDLQISTTPLRATLTPEQKRFNTLIRQIEAAREALAAWQAQIPLYQQAHAQRVKPLLDEFKAARREWVFALDKLLIQPGWGRNDRQTLQEMLCEAAGEMLDADAGDAELKALFDQHSEVDFDTDQQLASQAMKQMAEAMTGLDLGDDEGIRSEADLFQRLQERMAAEQAGTDAARAEHADRPPRHRASKAQQRREAEAQLATQSVREIYRKLASALHPDRETDPTQHAAKTSLMQRVNQAYAASDLLALLELQLEIEQVYAGHIAQASTQRVKHYNKVLAEQLAKLRAEIERVEMGFRLDAGLQVGWGLKPDKLALQIDQAVRELRAAVAAQRNELRQMGDRAAVKRWLKRHRQQQAESDDDFF